MSDSAEAWAVAHQAPLSVEFPRQEYWRTEGVDNDKGNTKPGDTGSGGQISITEVGGGLEGTSNHSPSIFQ